MAQHTKHHADFVALALNTVDQVLAPAAEAYYRCIEHDVCKYLILKKNVSIQPL
jgi:hypothetical protein